MSEVLETGTPVVNEPGITQEPVVQPVTDPVTEPVPSKITIDGLGEFDPNEIKEFKKGYMRQSDYTRKTQEVAKMREEAQEAMELMNYLKANPHVAQALVQRELAAQQGQKPPVVPSVENDRLKSVEHELQVFKLDSTIKALETKYPDFDEVAVLDYSVKEGIKDLEKAYKAMKAETFDPDAMRKQIEKEITEKFKQNGIATGTIIGNNDNPVAVDHGLSDLEKTIAAKMGMSPEEYAKWK